MQSLLLGVTRWAKMLLSNFLHWSPWYTCSKNGQKYKCDKSYLHFLSPVNSKITNENGKSTFHTSCFCTSSSKRISQVLVSVKGQQKTKFVNAQSFYLLAKSTKSNTFTYRTFSYICSNTENKCATLFIKTILWEHIGNFCYHVKSDFIQEFVTQNVHHTGQIKNWHP